MDKFSKKTSKALIIRGVLYLIAGITAFFLNLSRGGESIQLMSIVSMICGGVIIVAAFGHKKKQLVWYYTAVWGVLEFAFGAYLSAFEPDFEFFVNLFGILGILTSLFAITYSFNAKKKQNYFYLVAIVNGAWGFAISNFGEALEDYFGALLIGFLIVNGLFAIYGGLLYQSVQEKLHRRKTA